MKHLEELKTLSPETLRMLFCTYALAVKSKPCMNGSPLWSVVGALCCVGSTSAHELCRLAKLDPHQIVSRKLNGWHSFRTSE